MKKRILFLLTVLILEIFLFSYLRYNSFNKKIDEAGLEKVLIAYFEDKSSQNDSITFCFNTSTQQRKILIDFFDKNEIPPVEVITGFGNGTYVKLDGRKFILTAKHCILEKRKNMISGRNGADIILVPYQNGSLYKEITISDSLYLPQKCYLSFFHNLRSTRWTLRSVSGNVDWVNEDNVQNFISEENIHTSLQEQKKEILGLYNNTNQDGKNYIRQQFINKRDSALLQNVEIEEVLNLYYETLEREIIEREQKMLIGLLYMKVPADIHRFANGSSGSALIDSSGRIIGVTVLSVKSKNYLFFEPITKLKETTHY